MMRKSKEASISQYRIRPDEPAIITAIKYQKRDKLRASVFVAGEFSVSRIVKTDDVHVTVIVNIFEL